MPSPQEAEIQATMGDIQSRLMADKGAKHFQPQETAKTRKHLSKHQQNLLELLQKAKEDDWSADSRGPLRQRLLATISEEEKTKFKALDKYKKDTFAKKWMQAQYDELTTCSVTDEWRSRHIPRSVYVRKQSLSRRRRHHGRLRTHVQTLRKNCAWDFLSRVIMKELRDSTICILGKDTKR